MKRDAIKKSVRFRVFARDGFTCRYCGRASDEVKLVIDHVIAVANGGTNDEANLATSCDVCNSGKGIQTASPDPENENVRLSRLQAAREQKEAAEAAIASIKAERKMRRAMQNIWKDHVGTECGDSGTLSVMLSYADIYGAKRVSQWIAKAVERVGNFNDQRIGRFVSGIRRKSVTEGWV